MRVGPAGIFTRIPAILFGPVWGALISGLNDILGYVLRPTGAYLPHLTFTAASGGFICGALWLLVRKFDPGKIGLVVFFSSAAILLFGIINWYMFRLDGITPDFFYKYGNGYADTSEMFIISRLIATRSYVADIPGRTLATMITTFTWASMAVGVLGLMICGLDILLSRILKKDYKDYTSIMPLLIAMLVAAWVQNSLNTIVFRNYLFTAWQEIPFVVVWFPRIIQTTMTTVVYSYFVAFLVELLKRQKSLRSYAR